MDKLETIAIQKIKNKNLFEINEKIIGIYNEPNFSNQLYKSGGDNWNK